MFATEAEFVIGLQNNDPIAYEKLIEEFADMVFRVAYRMLQNEADAEDALQETFLTVYRRIGNFRGDSKFSSWLYRVATNVTLDIIRAKQRKQGNEQSSIDTLGEEEDIWLVDNVTPLPEQVLMQQDAIEALERGLKTLSPKLRTAFVLYELEELSINETAKVLEISESATKLRVHRARLALQKWVVEQAEGAKV